MEKDLQFINHAHEESASEASKSNPYEAAMIAVLVLHLLAQGYKKADIVILSAYQGQHTTICRELEKMRINTPNRGVDYVALGGGLRFDSGMLANSGVALAVLHLIEARVVSR